MALKLSTIVLLLFWFLTTAANAFGGSNIFGVFRKRRRTLDSIQDKRVEVAARRGFAGPHGELLTLQEFVALQQERAARQEQQDGVLGQILHAFDRFYNRHD